MSTLQEGQLFERYRIQRLLGHSVSGESYEAEDTMLLRKVTLKLIHPWATLPDSARRQFFREMQGISILNHPYLAAVLDFGEFNSRLYIARRYVSSSTLSGNEGRLWFRPPLNVSDTIRYIHQLAQALQYIHNHGYLHGSLTFSNILVLQGPNLDNEPDYAPFLLADVSLANFVRRFGQPQNQLLPIAAAPEQYSRRVTPASDQFALAVLLYFWLTGRPPYLGTPEEIEHLKLTETITPLSSFNPKVTFEQEGILLRALSVYPEDRYPSVLAFADSLLATLASETQVVPASEPVTQPEFTAPIESTRLEDEPQPEPIAEPEPVSGFEEATSNLENTTEVELPAQAEPAIYAENTVGAGPLAETDTTANFAFEAEEQGATIPRLIITSPYTEQPLEVRLESDEITLGRAGSSDILLDQDNLTSRHHALLKHEGNCYIIYDRRSANGVFVNGQKIDTEIGYELADGDHISIGNYELIFRLSPVMSMILE